MDTATKPYQTTTEPVVGISVRLDTNQWRPFSAVVTLTSPDGIDETITVDSERHAEEDRWLISVPLDKNKATVVVELTVPECGVLPAKSQTSTMDVWLTGRASTESATETVTPVPLGDTFCAAYVQLIGAYVLDRHDRRA